MKCVFCEKDILHVGGLELLERWKDNSESTLWLDLQGELGSAEKSLLEELGCHPLAIKDVQRQRHPPKVERFDDQIFILFRGFHTFDEHLNMDGQQIGVFLSPRMIITVHFAESVSISAIMESHNLASLLAEPKVLATHLLHFAAGRYLEVLLNFETELSQIEDLMDASASDEDMRQLVFYRSRIRKLKRTFDYHEKLALTLYQADWWGATVGSELHHSSRDVFDRCERLHSMAGMYYDICGDLIDGYLSLTSHQLNRTMQILTVITAIFIPLGFLAGLYGMNFEYMPELGFRYSYFILLGTMLCVAVTLISFFRRKRWL
ncbi:MAG: magnesium transporter [Halieaceae bacterium]|jgi:magnesium transporter